jgi:hypothetical protein
MYPSVRPGDKLTIEARAAAQLDVGDIAVIRRKNTMLGHRVVQKGVANDRTFVVTTPDRGVNGDDGPTYDEELLGVVTTIERKGKRLSTHQAAPAWPERIFLTLKLYLIEFYDRQAPRLSKLLAGIQKTFLYQPIIRAYFRVLKIKPRFVVQVPLKSRQSHDLVRVFTTDKFDPSQLTSEKSRAARFELSVVFKKESPPAARASFSHRPPQCPYPGWRLDALRVRVCYRGAGFEQALLSKAEKILAKSGMCFQRR